ncbi:MAG: ketoacyl-ACP synthase III [Nitrospiraceae bacterium]|nr:ketoacyl-ACP synthase III [Nitrospiraceae bacterium]
MEGKRFAKITATGMYLPEKVITNEELSKKMGFDVSQYLSGIKLRHIAAPNESSSDMAVEAAKEALKNAGMKAEDLDLIILTTDTPDIITPPTSLIIQHKLGAKNAAAFDMNGACADAVIGMTVASQYITTDSEINNVLVVASYGMTKWLDWDNKVLAPMFGDGASAVILSTSDKPGFLSSAMLADGSYWDSYGIYVGTKYPITKEMVDKKEHLLRFHPNLHKYPPDINYSRWPVLVKKVAKKAGYTVDDLNMVLFTQVRLIDIEKSMEGLNLPMEKTHYIMDKFGYTGSACVFMALHDALKEGKIKNNDLVAFSTSGAGMVMSAALFKWIE